MRLVLVLSLSVLVISCGGKQESSQKIVEVLKEESSCVKAQDLLWKTFYGLAESQIELEGDQEQLSENISTELAKAFPQWFEKPNQNLVSDFILSYVELYEKISQIQKNKNYSSWLRVLAQAELEIESSELLPKDLLQVQKLMAASSKSLESLRPVCKVSAVDKSDGSSDDLSTGAFLQKLKTENHPVVYGAKKVFLTAYQDCQLEDRVPAFDRRTSSVQGIVRLKKGHKNGVGGRRIIGNRNLLFNTHHYYGFRNGGSPNLKSFYEGKNSCLEQKKFLMIYDYGGKPASSSRANSSLNMFKHAVDSASPDLGIDCSGFVFSALASAGLKLHSQKQMIASQVYGVGANHLRKASPKVMPCLEKPPMIGSLSLQNGDIISTSGHTLIIDKVGPDPLAINKYLNEGRCADITYKDFTFDVLQSNPAKGAVGIHRMKGREHLRTSKSMRVPLVALAQKICKNESLEEKATTKPEISAGGYRLSVIRHLGTKACRGPEVRLTAQSCLNKCN